MQYTTHEEEQVKLDLTENDLFPLEIVVYGLMWLQVWQRWWWQGEVPGDSGERRLLRTR